MQHVGRVGGGEGVGDLAHDAHGLGHGERAVAVDPLAQRLAVDERHRLVKEPVRFARVEQRLDVRMLEPREEADLAREAVRAERRAELTLEEVMAGEGGVEAVGLLGQAGAWTESPRITSALRYRVGHGAATARADHPSGA